MNRAEIYLNKLNGVVLSGGTEVNPDVALAVNAEFMKLGFVMTSELLSILSTLSVEGITEFANKTIPILKKRVGADVNYEPMYPNFPQQVMEATDVELFMNALAHYWTLGEWKPNYEKASREFAFENVKFTKIDRILLKDYFGLFTKLLKSNDSLSDGDLDVIRFFLDNEKEEYLEYPAEIPFKENMVVVAKYLIEKGRDFSKLVKTPTDVLRIVTALNEGDTTLATNTKFKSIPRSQRRKLVTILEGVINEEDINRHKNKWIKLFHNLHIGDYANIAPKTLQIAKKARNNKALFSTASFAQACIDKCETEKAAGILAKRPGEFARRLDHLLRISHPDKQVVVVREFGNIAPKISTRVLLQVYGHFMHRDNETAPRVAFPKGNVQKAILLPKQKDKYDVSASADSLMSAIKKTLAERFKELDSLGKVYIDESLKECPLPTQQRSVSEGADLVARGTHLPIALDKNTLRFFIYWVGQDIDLSATFHDADFKMIERVAYTNLRSEIMEAYHSGDITYAPDGASEFIDISLDMVPPKVRYIAMNVLVYAGPNFCDHDVCYAGWMTRSEPNSNEIYDPKTVESKVDLTAASKNAIPVIFDVVERKAIWCDLTTSARFGYNPYGMTHRWNPLGNNVENNKASIEDVLKAITTINRTTLYDLFSMHAQARATEIVIDKEDADTVFSLEDGDVTPRSINTINSDYIG